MSITRVTYSQRERWAAAAMRAGVRIESSRDGQRAVRSTGPHTQQVVGRWNDAQAAGWLRIDL